MIYKEASINQYEDVARLHAYSWKRTYRGLLNDDFLDHHVDQERLAVWQQRTATPDPTRKVFVAEESGELRGFVCVFAPYDVEFGAFIDNLHAHPDYKRHGIGAKLMSMAAQWACTQQPHIPLYLWVLEGNHNARDFYERLGATNHERVVKDGPYGKNIAELRYVWPDASALIQHPFDQTFL